MAFETRLAKASWPAVKMRDIEALYNPMTVAERREGDAGHRLVDLAHRNDAAGFGPAGADAAGLFPGSGQGHQRRAARHVEGLPDAAHDRRVLAVPEQGVRRRELRLLPAHALRHAADQAALEARARRARRLDRRPARPGIRQASLPAGGEAAHGRAGRQPAQGVRRLDRRAGLDGSGDEARPRTTRSATSRSRSATRPSGRTTPAWSSTTTTCSATCCARVP